MSLLKTQVGNFIKFEHISYQGLAFATLRLNPAFISIFTCPLHPTAVDQAQQ